MNPKNEPKQDGFGTILPFPVKYLKFGYSISAAN